MLALGIELREMQAERGRTGILRKTLWLVLQTLLSVNNRAHCVYTNGQSVLSLLAWRVAHAHGGRLHHHHTAADNVERMTWHPKYRQVLTRCTRLVSCSKNGRMALARYAGRSDTCFMPYVAADIGSFSNPNVLRSGTVSLGFFGRLVTTKGIEYICALSTEPEFSGITWMISGGGDGYNEALFSAYPNVQFLGPYRDVKCYAERLAALNGVVLFSRHNEGMPLSLIEAASVGKLLLASDMGGTRELLGNLYHSELLPRIFNYIDLKHAVLRLAAKIQYGKEERLAVDSRLGLWLEPEAASEAWLSLLRHCARGKADRHTSDFPLRPGTTVPEA